MQKLLGVLALLGPLAGCTLVGPAVDGGVAQLPTGVTLLESDEDSCAGIIHVDEQSVSRSGEVVVRPGQNAAFRVDDERIAWTCIDATDEGSVNEDRVDCPDETSHVRITRTANDETFLVECFG